MTDDEQARFADGILLGLEAAAVIAERSAAFWIANQIRTYAKARREDAIEARQREAAP